jgi:hypothetical protein
MPSTDVPLIKPITRIVNYPSPKDLRTLRTNFSCLITQRRCDELDPSSAKKILPNLPSLSG